MRKLETGDVFGFVRMTKKIGITEELKKLIMSKDSIQDLTAESFGYDLIFLLFDKAAEDNSESEVYKFLSGPLEMEPEEIKKTDPIELMEMLKGIAEPEKWKSFFTSASKLMK